MKEIIPIGELKTHCYQILDSIHKTNKQVVITKRGTPVANIVPIANEKEQKSLFGIFVDYAEIKSDIVSSIDAEWHANE